MKRKLNEKDVLSVYNTLLSQAEKNCLHGEFNRALKDIEIAARWAYNFNVFFSDTKADQLLSLISNKCLAKKEVNSKCNRFVILDSEGLDNRGLTQQYLRALEANHFEFLFITLRFDLNPLKETIKEVNDSKYGHVLTFEGRTISSIEKAKLVSDAIIQFQAERILLHMMPWDVVSLIAVYSIKNIISYNINLTDHAFWLGSSFIDYNIEFRPYGKTVSIQKRRIDKSKILELPFYPIMPANSSFEGFPLVNDDAVIIFTGGAPYKMEDKNNTFFLKIIDGILEISSNVIVLVAGFSSDSEEFSKKTAMMKNKDRIYNIGVRKDINEVYKHCDIYLQTYPFYGGLMTQYAVINKVPILTYIEKNKQVEFLEIINHFGNAAKCFVDFDNFMEYTKKLIEDESFRKSEGEKCCNVMMNEERFNKMMPEVIVNKKEPFSWNLIDVDYKSLSKWYLSIAESKNYEILNMITNEYGALRSFILFPSCRLILLRLINVRMLYYNIKVWLYSFYHTDKNVKR